ncbi:uncharacterized protein [Clytia hemisphaerica]
MFKRSCIKESEQSKCLGNFEKYEGCEKEKAKPVTYQKETNVNGKVRVVDMKFEGKTLKNDKLQEKLDSKKDRQKLIIIARITLKKLFLNKGIDFIEIEILDLKIGSLIIEYVVSLESLGVKNKTIKDLNPVKEETTVFEDISQYRGVIEPVYSHISDVDVCKEKDPCDKNAHCLKFPGQIPIACQCMDGYEGDGFSCEQESSFPVHMAIIIVLCLMGVFLLILILLLCRWLRRRDKEFRERGKDNYYGRCHSDSFQFEIVRKTTLDYNRGIENRTAILTSISEEENMKHDHEYDATSICKTDSETLGSDILDSDNKYDAVSIASSHDYDALEKLDYMLDNQEYHEVEFDQDYIDGCGEGVDENSC